MDLIFLAAGFGQRSGLKYPKQFYMINGKPMAIYALEVFQEMVEIKNIFISYDIKSKKIFEEMLDIYAINKAKLVLGGATRQESVFNLLSYVKSEKVMIHEAARPMINTDFINSLINYSINKDCVVPVIKIPFTVACGDFLMERALEREKLRNIQLPQIFNTNILKNVHHFAKNENVQATEDSMLLFKYGYDVNFHKGLHSNIKVTSPLDLIIINKLMEIGR